MENYTRVRRANTESVPPAENEVRVMSNGRLRTYVTQALERLEDKGMQSIVLKAMGRAINKTVAIAEIVKRRVAGLHQLTELGSVAITDTWMPKENAEGLNPLHATRYVSAITIQLSTAGFDPNLPGYQPPLPAEEVVPIADPELHEMELGDNSGRRGRGRGMRGRGRGRGGRGRGRGRGAPPQGVEGGHMDADGLAELGAAEGGVGPEGHLHPEGGQGAPAGGRGRGRGGRYRGRGRGRGRGGRSKGRHQQQEGGEQGGPAAGEA